MPKYNPTANGYMVNDFRILDANNDGIKDFSYIDSGNNPDMNRKTVFIRRGNTFVKKDFYQQ